MKKIIFVSIFLFSLILNNSVYSLALKSNVNEIAEIEKIKQCIMKNVI